MPDNAIRRVTRGSDELIRCQDRAARRICRLIFLVATRRWRDLVPHVFPTRLLKFVLRLNGPLDCNLMRNVLVNRWLFV